MIFDSIIGWFSKDLAIDLGTANTVVFVKDKGIVLREPSVVAVAKDEMAVKRIIAVGKKAKEMLGKTPGNIQAIRPLRDGVIADFEAAQAMIRYFISSVHQRSMLLRPIIVVGIPHGITEVEKRAVREAAESAGAREVFLVEEPMAAAIGAGINVEEPSGNMIVDIGGGTTEVAVISLAGIVQSFSEKVAGDKMDEAIVAYIKKKYNVLIGEQTAERVKIEIGNAKPERGKDERKMIVKGRDIVTGIPKHIEVSESEIAEALYEPLKIISEAIRSTLEKTPPELSSDIIEKGVLLTGGGSLLKNLDAFIKDEVQLPVSVVDNPLDSVALGCGALLNNPDLLSRIAVD